MSDYQTIAVPFITVGNRQVLTREQLCNEPHLAKFVKSFPACFEQSLVGDYWTYYPNGDAPNG